MKDLHIDLIHKQDLFIDPTIESKELLNHWKKIQKNIALPSSKHPQKPTSSSTLNSVSDASQVKKKSLSTSTKKVSETKTTHSTTSTSTLSSQTQSTSIPNSIKTKLSSQQSTPTSIKKNPVVSKRKTTSPQQQKHCIDDLNSLYIQMGTLVQSIKKNQEAL